MAKVEFDFRNNEVPKGFSLVTREGKSYLRRKGGASKERIMNDPAMVRVWQNASAFTELSKLSKSLFDATAPFTKGIRDSRVYFRLVGLLNNIKKRNAILEPNQKSPLIAMDTYQGRQMMTGFNFNDKINLSEIFSPKIHLNESENTFILSCITIPANITKHSKISMSTIIMGRVSIDKQSGQCTFDISNHVNIQHNQNFEPKEFVFNTTQSENSIHLYLCKVQFQIDSSSKKYKEGLNGSCAIIHV